MADGTSNARSLDEPAAEWVEIGKLAPWKKNPRRNDANVARVMESIKRFGFAAPIVARKADGEVIAGHTRLKAAQALGLARVPVRYLDLDLADAHLLALADNRLNELSPWDTAELTSILSEYGLESAALAGWDSADLEKMGAELLAGATEPAGEVVEDEVPEPLKVPVTKLGDVWELGDHVLVCGDCRDLPTVRKLVGTVRVNVAFTSPPYASQRKYDESSGFKPIHPDEFVDWFDSVQANVRDVLAPNGSWFVNIKEHCDDGQRHLYVKDLTIAHVRKWGWRFVDELLWIHGGTPCEVRRRFKNGHEPIFQFTMEHDFKFRPEAVMRESDGVRGKYSERKRPRIDTAKSQGKTGDIFSNPEIGHGLAYPSNALKMGKNRELLGHGAAFPVELPAFFVKAYSDKGDVVFDPFLGSGTTLIACEQLGRKCVGSELSPAYCDVIISRWEQFTGKKAVLRGH